MRRVLVAAYAGAALGATLLVPAGAQGAGGPVPPQQGGVGTSVPGGDVNFVAVAAGADTVLQRVRRDGGAVERTRLLRGRLGIPGVAYDGSTTGLSADGRTLVLAESPKVPRFPVHRTRLVVVDARHLQPSARITLRGFFTVDAISPDGRWLYLIRYPSNDLNRYEVRAYDVRRRTLTPAPVIDAREPGESMNGFPITRTTSADGRWAYTLYDRSGKPPFIHALDTQSRAARCIDLDGLSSEDVGPAHLSLAGGKLSVQGETGPLAIVDTRTFAVHRGPAPSTQPFSAPAQAQAHESGSGTPWAAVGAGVGAALVALVGLGAVHRRRRRVGLAA